MREESLIKTILNPYTMAALRHLLTALGPVVALVLAYDEPWDLVYALIEPENMAYLGGVLMAVVGVVASFKDKQSRKDAELKARLEEIIE